MIELKDKETNIVGKIDGTDIMLVLEKNMAFKKRQDFKNDLLNPRPRPEVPRTPVISFRVGKDKRLYQLEVTLSSILLTVVILLQLASLIVQYFPVAP